jgi:chromosome segregation protein
MKREDMETRVGDIEAELQKIGFVNLKAPEMYEERLRDYNEIKDRVNILSTEKEAVVKMIDEIDSRKKEVFMKTYDAVSEHFKKLATTISKYEANLKLENEADPFEGGLHIIVKTGKKDRNVELMSGGEKSLMTLVFVFALHMYRPSQFYILDETEAALDKENSKRFAELVKELSKQTQFIVVSHNDSVIPFADVALGVTKSKQGSKIVGIKLMQTS